jgi:hypothetical protein
VDPINFPNIYAIGGGQSGQANTSPADNLNFVFLYDIVNHTSSNLLFLGQSLNTNYKSTAGLGIINHLDPNGVIDARCLVVHSNSRRLGTTIPSSTLNLIKMDLSSMTLTLNNAYELQPGTAKYNGTDLKISGNYAYTISSNFPTIPTFSLITRSLIEYNTGAGEFSITNAANITRRRIDDQNGFRLVLNQLHIVNGKLVMIGNYSGTGFESNIIIEADMDNLFQTNFNTPTAVRFFDGQSRNLICGSAIDPTNSNKIILNIGSNALSVNTLEPHIAIYDRTLSDFIPIQNTTDKNAIRFNQPGLGAQWSPICVNGNTIALTAFNKGSTSTSNSGMNNYTYEYNSNGLAQPLENNSCVNLNKFTPLSADITVTNPTFSYSPNNHNYSSTTINLVPLVLTKPDTICTTPPPCIPLVATVVGCQNIQLSVPGYNNVSWNDNGAISTGPSITISDINCHNITYSYEGAVCTESFQACLTPGSCQANPARTSNQPEMTRWTLDNIVTDFASAQKQMKDGNKHTLCYEKYSEKNSKFEQISCEEVQSTEDITKVAFDFSAYPSPANDQITIDVTNFSTEDTYKAILYTNTGSLIKEFKLKSKSAQYALDEVNSGSYILTMYQGNKKVSSKTIIVRK